MILKYQKVILFLLLAATSIYGMWSLKQSTPYGLGLVNDSASYVGGAKNLLAGNGYMRTSGAGELKPLVHFPPLFSLLLAAGAATGLNILFAARIIVLLLFGLDILLVGLLVYSVSRSIGLAFIGALFLASSDTFLHIYSFVLSEPLAFTLMLLNFYTFAEYYEKRRWYWMALAGLLLGLGFLARYANSSFIVALTLAVLVLDWPANKSPFKLKNLPLRELSLLLGTGLPLVIYWMARNYILAGTTTNRVLAWHPVSLPKYFEGLKNLLTWLAPEVILKVFSPLGYGFSFLALLFLPALLAGMVWAWKRSRPNRKDAIAINAPFAMLFAMAVYILTYLVFLIISISLFDASTPLDSRLFSPIYLLEIILLTCGLGWVWRRRTVVRIVTALVVIILVGTQVYDGRVAVRDISKDGQGFASLYWQHSKTLQYVQQMPPGTIIYSNRPTGIQLTTDHNAYVTPTPTDSATNLARPDYQSEVDKMKAAIQEGRAVLILFGLANPTSVESIQYYNDMTAGLRLVEDNEDAQIFEAAH